MEKLTTEGFIKKAKLIHGDKYDYSKVEYKGYYQKVCIICPKHGEFYLTPGNHLLGRGCKKCQLELNTLTQELFIQKGQHIHGDKYLYDKVKYINCHTKVTITCKKHGDWESTPYNFLSGNGCPKCRIKTTITRKNKEVMRDKKSFVDLANKVHNYKYSYDKSDYVNSKTKLVITCPIHGDFELTPTDHVHKKCGCFKCGHNIYTQDEFNDKCNKIHNNKYDYTKTVYKGIRNHITVTCPEHGDFIQTAHSHLKGYGCPKCTLKAQTKLYNRLCSYFPNLEILFEVSGNTVKWLKKQRLDMYFPKYNIAIEFDGVLHTKPVEIFGGEERFILQLELDTKKEELCTKNNCTLIRVLYNYTDDDFDQVCLKIKNIIDNYDNK